MKPENAAVETWIAMWLGYDGPLPCGADKGFAPSPSNDAFSIESRRWLARNARSLIKRPKNAAADAWLEGRLGWDGPLPPEVIAHFTPMEGREDYGFGRSPFEDSLSVEARIYLAKYALSLPSAAWLRLKDDNNPLVREACGAALLMSELVPYLPPGYPPHRAALAGDFSLQLELATSWNADARRKFAMLGPLSRAAQELLCVSEDRETRECLARNQGADCRLEFHVVEALLDGKEKGGRSAQFVAMNEVALRDRPLLQFRIARHGSLRIRGSLAMNAALLPEVAAELVINGDAQIRRTIAMNRAALNGCPQVRRALVLERDPYVSEVMTTGALCPWHDVTVLRLLAGDEMGDMNEGALAEAFGDAYLEAGGDFVLGCGLRFAYDAASKRWGYDSGFPRSMKLDLAYADFPADARAVMWREAQARPELSGLAAIILSEMMVA